MNAIPPAPTGANDMTYARGPQEYSDREIARALERICTPPRADAAYWAGLHTRIMGGVAAAAPAPPWWAIAPSTAVAGLIAAAFALLALGALERQTREVEARMALQAAMVTDLEVARMLPDIDDPLGRATRREPVGARR